MIENNTSILLFRRNAAEALVSHWLSKSYLDLTGISRWTFNGKPASSVDPDFHTLTRESIPKPVIKGHLRVQELALKFLQQAKELKTCLPVAYEDLYGEKGSEYFIKICNHFNIPKKALQKIEDGNKNPQWQYILNPKRRMNPRDETYKLIPNIEEILEMEERFLSDDLYRSLDEL